MFIEWNEKYNVGIASIDAEHRQLANLINELYEATEKKDIEERESSLKEALKKSVEYVKIHFANEEAIMIKYDYPDFLKHKQEHNDFVLKIIETSQKLNLNDRLLTLKYAQFLKDWLLQHIAVTDKQYTYYYKEIGANPE